MVITYMYWNNPIQEYVWPSDQDPIASAHQHNHCLFFDPAMDKQRIRSNQSLQALCDWANQGISRSGVQGFVRDPANHYDIANLVKLNLWVHDLPLTGSIKPMLLQHIGRPLFESGTGESRLRALERIPHMTTVSAFISTHVKHEQQFAHLERIETFDRFAELCAAESGQRFLFRFTDRKAPYAIDWYEYNSSRTAQVTPGTPHCVEVMSNYLYRNPGMVFSPQWFDALVDWSSYKNS